MEYKRQVFNINKNKISIINDADVNTSGQSIYVHHQMSGFKEKSDQTDVQVYIGIYWNEKSRQFYVHMNLKKLKCKTKKIIVPDVQVHLKCDISGFGTHYCSISRDKLTKIYLHRQYSQEITFNSDIEMEIIPFLPPDMTSTLQLPPLLALSHFTLMPPIKHYDSQWPFTSYIRQIQSTGDANIPFPQIDSIDSLSITKNQNIADFIFEVTKNICNELGIKCQCIADSPQCVYTDKSKHKIKSKKIKMLIFAIPNENQIQEEVPSIISNGFNDAKPYHLCSVVKKEANENNVYFATIYSSTLDSFYVVGNKCMKRIECNPSKYFENEILVSALYIRLDLLDEFRVFCPHPPIIYRENNVKVYEVKKTFIFSNENADTFDFRILEDKNIYQNFVPFIQPQPESADLLDNLQDTLVSFDSYNGNMNFNNFINNNNNNNNNNSNIPNESENSYEYGNHKCYNYPKNPDNSKGDIGLLYLFHYDPPKYSFPAAPLGSTAGKSVLKLSFDARIILFQLIWYCTSDYNCYFPIVYDFSRGGMKIPPGYKLCNVSANYILRYHNILDYPEDRCVPAKNSLILFKLKNDIIISKSIEQPAKACTFSFGKIISFGTLNQFIQPPIFVNVNKMELANVLNFICYNRKINASSYRLYMRIYLKEKPNKTMWMKMDADVNKSGQYFSDHFNEFGSLPFVQFFIETFD